MPQVADSSNAALKEAAEDVLMMNYGERNIALVRGRGTRVWDADGREYLDFCAGIAVCNLGHCHPRVTKALQEQAGQLLHVSNLYLIEPQIRLARLLCGHSFASKAFFCNSGAEAVESAIKLARKFAKDTGHPERYEVVTLEGSFHGRTLAAITATGQKKYHTQGFEPLPQGFRYAPMDDPSALEKAVTPETAALLIEPVQGEGGVRPLSPGYLEAARGVCDRSGTLLMFDEVQCGMGRTGTLFAHQQYGVEPDAMTLAKALGNGVPIGALLTNEKCSATFTAGTHAATFGGNPLVTAAAVATLETMLEEKIPDRAARLGSFFLAELRTLARSIPAVKEVRGKGLMIGIELEEEAKPLVQKLCEKGVLALTAGPNVLRFLPPLTVTEEEIRTVLGRLGEVLSEMKKEGDDL